MTFQEGEIWITTKKYWTEKGFGLRYWEGFGKRRGYFNFTPKIFYGIVGPQCPVPARAGRWFYDFDTESYGGYVNHEETEKRYTREQAVKVNEMVLDVLQHLSAGLVLPETPPAATAPAPAPAPDSTENWSGPEPDPKAGAGPTRPWG